MTLDKVPKFPERISNRWEHRFHDRYKAVGFVSGWRLVRVIPTSCPESVPILAVPTGFGHIAVSDSSDPGRVRTQYVLNVIGFGHVMSPTREMSCGF